MYYRKKLKNTGMLKEILTLEKDESILLEVLYLASQKVTISYEEIVKIIGQEEIEDFLLETERNKLLLPVVSSRSAAWKDRLLLVKPAEKYRMPNVIRLLIDNLYNKREWKVDYAIASYFKQIGESQWSNMPNFYRRIRQKAKNNKVSSQDIKIIAREFHMEEKTGALIAELKGAGLISPFLSSIPKGQFPLYEINPSVREFP